MTIKLSREPLYEQAYEAVLRMILDGTLQPGERLTETSLAKLLGVSPTPVREAMRKLEHDGLLQSNGAGLQVVELSPKDVEQLYVCREALEVVAIKSAVDNLDEADLVELDTILTEAQRVANQGDFLELVRVNTAFHDKLIAASGNPWLMSAMGFVRRPLLFARIQITLNQDESQRILSDHRAILQALQRHDATAAVEAMRRHLHIDCEHMCQRLAQRLNKYVG